MICEMPTAYILSVRKARKQHKCYECGGSIMPGEKYNYHSGVWDGRGDSFKVCLDCDDLRADMDGHCEFDDERTAFGNIRYDVGNFDKDAGFLERFKAIIAQRAARSEQEKELTA